MIRLSILIQCVHEFDLVLHPRIPFGFVAISNLDLANTRLHVQRVMHTQSMVAILAIMDSCTRLGVI